ncbi:uncharacterized protein PHALS_02491 [Plasmopara halstedii]|uniref:Uncharacterized protein n=1 Tax=Plasmopara halstedii TaxID=4781 RepID=A0A0P1A7F2_PLAHL|nr:uncharacterized protein PHALS_02491 [Plasmopara halstedii]CEG36391.1 hypothetical protein PHALS_02491 [Plasmopara halstedii]|eukprot:XP_024572760.1 hypothetical protein PHALS_02491 [Plasmopara halstedii]
MDVGSRDASNAPNIASKRCSTGYNRVKPSFDPVNYLHKRLNIMHVTIGKSRILVSLTGDARAAHKHATYWVCDIQTQQGNRFLPTHLSQRESISLITCSQTRLQDRKEKARW